MSEDKNMNRGITAAMIVIALLLAVIAAGIGIIAMEMRPPIQESMVLDADHEIKLAKDTLFNSGIISILLDNISGYSESWNFFTANTGKYVVEANGRVLDPERLRKAVYSSWVGSYGAGNIEYYTDHAFLSVDYRIQFVKEIGIPFDTEYDNYETSYTEWTVKYLDDSGQEQTAVINGGNTCMFQVMSGYLQDPEL